MLFLLKIIAVTKIINNEVHIIGPNRDINIIEAVEIAPPLLNANIQDLV